MGVKADLIAAARRWQRLRDETARVRSERNSLRCEAAEPAEHDLGDAGVAPCYLSAEYDRRGWPREPSAWCDTCRLRSVLHVLYLILVARRNGAERRLVAAARKLQGNP